MTDKAIWQPSAGAMEQTNMGQFIRFVAGEFDEEITDYEALYAFSINRPGQFWQSVWEFCGIRSSARWSSVVKGFDRMPGAAWFPEARLNFAQNLLRYDDDQVALLFRGESGATMQVTYAQLNQRVAQLAAALRLSGVTPGDRVAGFLPNLPHTVIAMLAAASVGAIWSSCSPDFGIAGVVDRLGQVAPKILFAADGYFYAGKRIDVRDRIAGIVAELPSVEQVVLIPYLDRQVSAEGTPKAILFNDYLSRSAASKPEFAQLPFDHPLYIMFSSGTTGVPKCIVHGAGGTLIQHLKELVLHSDLGRDDRIFYFTTCGWMMWNWLVTSLAAGATVVLYDGSPFHPGPEVLFDLIDRHQINIFGTSAKWLSAVEKAGFEPRSSHQLTSLRTILSTGSPLAPASYDFVQEHVKPGVCLSSISGGTDIISCFALGNPLLPVYRGELQCRGLGMRVEILDDQGNPQPAGSVGELSCTQPFPSMPIEFWQDGDGSRYHAAYFDKIPGVWCHGDLAELTPRDGLIIHGRSDATLNPGGVRIGTAEIYRQVEKIPEVTESLAIDQSWENDVRIVLFVTLRPDMELDQGLQNRIRKMIRDQTTPRHVPAKILQVQEIPRTVSGKIVELAVRNVVHGEPVKNVGALANPEVLEQFMNLPELQL